LNIDPENFNFLVETRLFGRVQILICREKLGDTQLFLDIASTSFNQRHFWDLGPVGDQYPKLGRLDPLWVDLWEDLQKKKRLMPAILLWAA
jgi:hypothetical protein